MPTLYYDKFDRTLTVLPTPERARGRRLILLHGATPSGYHLGSWWDDLPPGIWSVGGTAVRLAKKGFEVFVPEAGDGAGRPGAWMERSLAWASAGGPIPDVAGFSFGGSSAILLARRAERSLCIGPLFRLGKLYGLDPAIRSRAIADDLAKMTTPMEVLFAQTYRTHGRQRFDAHAQVRTQHVPGTRHRHFAIPMGVLGPLYAFVDAGVERAHAAFEALLGV